MRIEHLVPPVELCRMIPADNFLDTAFCWHFTEVSGFVCRTSGCEQVSGKQWMLERSTSGKIVRYRQRGEQIFPAPTLKEILSAIPIGEVGIFCCYSGDGDWSIGDCEHDLYVKNGYEGKSPEASALKWWLKLKGN